jgi:putative FmdB family regulatory protein
MPRYAYTCANCVKSWEEDRPVEYRNAPCVMPCPKCGEYYVNRVRSVPNIIVPEGNCGNAANNYTSKKGD